MSGVIEEFKPLVRNTLRGFCRVRLPSGMVLHDCAVHEKEGRVWVAPPGRPIVDREGNLVREPNGKLRYAPTISFANRETQDRFSNTAIEALRAAYPEALT